MATDPTTTDPNQQNQGTNTPTAVPGADQSQITLPNLATSIPDLQDYTNLQAQAPQLPQGTAVQPVYQSVQQGEDLTYTGVDPTEQSQPTAQAQATNVNTIGQVGSPDTTNLQNTANNTYNATDINSIPTAQAAQTTLQSGDLLSATIGKLITPDANGQFPAWAAPALTQIQQQLAARGIDNSSMAGQAITSALLDAAVPIAQGDVAAFQNVQMANLTNEQQANLATYQGQIQTLLSNQSADNAAKQFNATNQSQVNEFLASMASNISQFNATAANTINTFNAQQDTQVSQTNATMANTMSQFNANLANQREQFNVTNAMQVQQSNATWRRQLNTQNTAVANQANQINALNSLQISQSAYNNMWQQFSDEASWAYSTSQNAQDFSNSMALLIKQYQLIGSNAVSAQDNALTNGMYQSAAQLGGQIAGNIAKSIIGSGSDSSSSSSDQVAQDVSNEGGLQGVLDNVTSGNEFNNG